MKDMEGEVEAQSMCLGSEQGGGVPKEDRDIPRKEEVRFILDVG